MARKPRKRKGNPNNRHKTHGGQPYAHKVGKEMRIAKLEKENVERERKIARYHRQCAEQEYAQFRADYHALRLTYLH